MESFEPVEPAGDPLPVARVVKSDERRAVGGAEVRERDVDVRTRAQKACDKLPSCNSSWCDIGGCDLPCEGALELLTVLEGCDVGCG